MEEPTDIEQQKAIRLIAGPCSAESAEQLLDVAHGLQGIEIESFRAGLWKPRTQPGNFEGVGKVGLPWLLQIQKEFGYKVATEVCLPEHAHLALEAGVDILWLGARTVSNPYAVQSIAEVLHSSSVKVLVKNPISPDLSLWVGAIERLQAVGVSDITAVFRGFSTYPSAQFLYRNTPYWSVAFELKRLFPDMDLFCDPSHITGKSEEVGVMSQKAMDLGFDGLMIESHTKPDTALSDARQQITPKELKEIIKGITPRDNRFCEDDLLNKYRMMLTESDELLLSILTRRMNISRQIGQYKHSSQMPILQVEQFANILKGRIQIGESLGLDKSFVQRIISLIHEESVRIQIEENNKKNNI